MTDRRRSVLSLVFDALRGRVREFTGEAKLQLDASAGELRRELEDDVAALEPRKKSRVAEASPGTPGDGRDGGAGERG